MIEKTYTNERAAELFTVIAHDPERHLYLMEDQTIGFGFICTPLQGFDEKAGDRINVLLNGDFPDDTLMNFCLFGSPDIKREMEEMQRKRTDVNGQLLVDLGKQRAKFLENGTEEYIEPSTSMYVRNFSLVVTVKMPINAPEPTEKELKTCENLKSSFLASLKTVGLMPEALIAEDYIRLMNTICNWGGGASWRRQRYFNLDDDKPLKEQIMDFDSSIGVDTSGLWLGEERRVKSLSVKRYPRSFFFGAGASYIGDLLTGSRGIRENCIISATIHFPPAQKAKAAMERKRQWAVNQAYGPMLKFVPMLAAKKKGYDVLYEALEEGDRIVRLHLGMMIFAKDEESALGAVSSARSYWGELGFGLMEDRYYTLPLVLNKLPFGADAKAMKDLFRYKSMATRHAITMLPVFSDWRGTGSPVLHFLSRNGQLQRVSLFDSGSNYNCTIAAQSGSGKSFLTNDIISNYLAIGGKAWVIDVGRSYIDLADILKGDFVEFSKESKICLNPFPVIDDWEEDEDVIVSLLSIMAAPTEKLSDFQSSRLKEILKRVWDKKGKSTTIDDIADEAIKDSDQRVRDVGFQLYPFTSKGEYGKFFIGENNVKFDNPFTVLELEELKGRTHLQQVVLLQLIYNIQKDMYLGRRDRPKLCIIDEAWSLLSGENVGSFIEHGFRRFRKYGGCAIVVTQSVQDLYQTKTGEAIARNSANMYLLGQKSEDIAQLHRDERLSLNDGGYQLLKSVHTIPGVYSEIFFITEYGAGIGRLIVDPFTQLLYSTKAEDVNAIQVKREQGMSVTDAINAVLADRGQNANTELKGVA